jgi:hypothetical protein
VTLKLDLILFTISSRAGGSIPFTHVEKKHNFLVPFCFCLVFFSFREQVRKVKGDSFLLFLLGNRSRADQMTRQVALQQRESDGQAIRLQKSEERRITLNLLLASRILKVVRLDVLADEFGDVGQGQLGIGVSLEE